MTITTQKAHRSRGKPNRVAQDAAATPHGAEQPIPGRGPDPSAATPEADTPAAAPQSEHEAAPQAAAEDARVRAEQTPLPSPTAKVTKVAQLEALLAAPEGATLAGLCSTLGWQSHTVRAALTRLRRAGHRIERSRTEDGQTVYRILAIRPPEATVALGAAGA